MTKVPAGSRSPINAGSHTYELRAAVHALNTWLTTGHAPPQSPRLEVNRADPHAFVDDANGNALGGIGSPQVGAPVAKLSGVGQPGGAPVHPRAGANKAVSGQALCGIFGTTVPFSAAKLAALYPTHADFVTKWDAATAGGVKQGYLLPDDAQTLDHVAA